MGITIQWDNTYHTALSYRFDSMWTWEEFDEAIHHTSILLGAPGHRVDIILDMQSVNRLPYGTDNYYRCLDDRAVSLNVGDVLVVREERFSNSFWLYFWAIFAKTHQIPDDRDCVRYAGSIEEARTIINSVHA